MRQTSWPLWPLGWVTSVIMCTDSSIDSSIVFVWATDIANEGDWDGIFVKKGDWDGALQD